MSAAGSPGDVTVWDTCVNPVAGSYHQSAAQVNTNTDRIQTHTPIPGSHGIQTVWLHTGCRMTDIRRGCCGGVIRAVSQTDRSLYPRTDHSSLRSPHWQPCYRGARWRLNDSGTSIGGGAAVRWGADGAGWAHSAQLSHSYHPQIPGKREIFSQGWVNLETTSLTLAQHEPSVGWLFDVCWAQCIPQGRIVNGKNCQYYCKVGQPSKHETLNQCWLNVGSDQPQVSNWLIVNAALLSIQRRRW